jgi:hypothetical protein
MFSSSKILPTHGMMAVFAQQNEPLLEWPQLSNTKKSKNILQCIRHLQRVHISFRDERSYRNLLWFTIEFPRRIFGTFRKKNEILGIGLFFMRNLDTGVVDLMYCVQRDTGYYSSTLFKDCNYFGLDFDTEIQPFHGYAIRTYLSKFIVSNQNQDKALNTEVNFYSEKFLFNKSSIGYIVECANDFIQSTKIICDCIPEVAPAYPLLHVYDLKNRNALCIAHPVTTDVTEYPPLAPCFVVVDQEHTNDL